jgi:hypothetical protein
MFYCNRQIKIYEEKKKRLDFLKYDSSFLLVMRCYQGQWDTGLFYHHCYFNTKMQLSTFSNNCQYVLSLSAAHIKIQEGSILFGLWRRENDELFYGRVTVRIYPGSWYLHNMLCTIAQQAFPNSERCAQIMSYCNDLVCIGTNKIHGFCRVSKKKKILKKKERRRRKEKKRKA